MNQTLVFIIITIVVPIGIAWVVFTKSRRDKGAVAALAREAANYRQAGGEQREDERRNKAKRDEEWKMVTQPLIDKLVLTSLEIDKEDLHYVICEIEPKLSKPILPLLDLKQRAVFENVCSEYKRVYDEVSNRDHFPPISEFDEQEEISLLITSQGKKELRDAVSAVREFLSR